jgi:hypothetical protein
MAKSEDVDLSESYVAISRVATGWADITLTEWFDLVLK